MKTFKLEVLASDRPFFEGDSESVTFTTLDGQYGVLAGHRNTILALSEGLIKITDEKGNTQEAISGPGMVKIQDGNVFILTERCETREEYAFRLEKEEEIRRQELYLQRQSANEYKMAQAGIAKAMSKLKKGND